MFSHDECELEIIAESAEGRCDVNPSFWASSNACILDACSAKRASRRLLPRVLGCLTVIRMQQQTETLEVGSRAPEFALEAANRDGVFTLSGFLRRAVLVIEFLRGTW
jgi:hypothetical protein